MLDDRPVGLAHCLFHHSTIDVALTCYLQDLFVAESCRGLGVGSALLTGVLARARDADAPRVHWRTHETNTTAMRLYDTYATRPPFVLYEATTGPAGR